jgi:thioredoxin 1
MKANFNELINSEIPVLVDFYADWCGPCQAMKPILQEVKTQLQDDIKIIKINVDSNQNLATTYQVRSIPTLIIFKNQKTLWKHSGVLSTQELIQQIKKIS